MKHLVILVLPLSFILASPVSADGKRDDSNQRKRAARQYLQIKYDDYDDLGNGRRILYGLAYNPKTPLEPITVKELAKVLPATTFLRTTLDTNYFDYLKVEVIVAVTQSGNKHVIRSCLSPLFTIPSRKFLALIRGKSTMSDEQRKQLAIGMGKLLAAITHKGHVKNAHVSKRHASVELWHGDCPWRNIHIYFDKNNCVEHVLEGSTDKKRKAR